MGLIGEVSGVFDFLRGVYDCFPTAVKLLITSAFGGMIYISVLKSIRR